MNLIQALPIKAGLNALVFCLGDEPMQPSMYQSFVTPTEADTTLAETSSQKLASYDFSKSPSKAWLTF